MQKQIHFKFIAECGPLLFKVILEITASHFYGPQWRSFTCSLQMRDMNHENVNQFIGLCTDAPHISIAMVYCIRRSIMVIQLSMLPGVEIHIFRTVRLLFYSVLRPTKDHILLMRLISTDFASSYFSGIYRVWLKWRYGVLRKAASVLKNRVCVKQEGKGKMGFLV